MDQAQDGPVPVREQVDLHRGRPRRDAEAGRLQVGWRDTDQMFRVVTFGWGQMLARLKGFADTGKPMPYFDF